MAVPSGAVVSEEERKLADLSLSFSLSLSLSLSRSLSLSLSFSLSRSLLGRVSFHHLRSALAACDGVG